MRSWILCAILRGESCRFIIELQQQYYHIHRPPAVHTALVAGSWVLLPLLVPVKICATKPSSPPRVTLTLYRPFRTIVQDCLLHVRYRDGARVIRYPCLSMFDAFRTFGKQNRPFAFAPRPKSYRSRPPSYPRLLFSLRAYDTYRANAARSPCSFLVLRRRGTAGQLLLVSLSPCRSYGRNHGSRPASTASLSTGKGTSCGPLVCLCYTRVAMHGRSFPSARVVVVVLPLSSVLNVFPSVEPTTIVNVCICLLYTSPSPRDRTRSRMPSSA